MTDAVFDTTVFIDSHNRLSGATSLMEAASTGRLAAAYSSTSVFELWSREMSRDEETYHRANLIFLREVPFTSDLAMQVGAWLRSATRVQRLRFAADAMIAATAASLGATIYTRNPRDFTRFYTDVKSY